ncbi:hypothetical protein DN068_15765 [Taibaiella soli]|uniref:Uncharacterized protein n=2 Tax=Taibaiella soli TaxID=1649169 RepID=A0A2W2A9D3_9BACT|nr:hypothetical protein DN068_15765 [Taibaiella soli]
MAVWAQKPKKEMKKPVTPPVAMKETQVYLGNSLLSGGEITKHQFDSLVAQGLKTDMGVGTVSGFTFSYAERGIFEDSVGNPIERVELLSEVCKGDTLPAYLKSSLVERSKRGDTAYFEHVAVRTVDGAVVPGKSMKFVLTK